MKRNSRSLVLSLCTFLCLGGCVQTPGEGGRGSIVGHIQEEARLVLTNPSTAAAPYAATDHDVFLIYGENIGPDDQVETNHQGDFVFPWLRPGDYPVYTYSKDTSGVVPARDMVVLQAVTIESNTQTVTLDTLTVFDNI